MIPEFPMEIMDKNHGIFPALRAASGPTRESFGAEGSSESGYTLRCHLGIDLISYLSNRYLTGWWFQFL